MEWKNEIGSFLNILFTLISTDSIYDYSLVSMLNHIAPLNFPNVTSLHQENYQLFYISILCLSLSYLFKWETQTWFNMNHWSKVFNSIKALLLWSSLLELLTLPCHYPQKDKYRFTYFKNFMPRSYKKKKSPSLSSVQCCLVWSQ